MLTRLQPVLTGPAPGGATEEGATKRKVVFKIKPKAAAAVTAAHPPLQLQREWPIACTLGEEIDEIIRDWYAALGQPIPAEEVGIGARIEAEERGEMAEALSAPPPAGAAGPKPEFGTPEFWAWARKRKKEKDAEKAMKDTEKAAAAKAKAKAEAAAVALAEKERARAEKEAAKAAKEAAKAAKAKKK